MFAKQLKNALEGLDPAQLESMAVHVKLGEDERIEVVEDELGRVLMKPHRSDARLLPGQEQKENICSATSQLGRPLVS